MAAVPKGLNSNTQSSIVESVPQKSFDDRVPTTVEDCAPLMEQQMKQWVYIPRLPDDKRARIWPESSDKCCDHCGLRFTAVPWMKPMRRLCDGVLETDSEGIYEMSGNFCSVGCVAADVHHSNTFESVQQLSWLAQIAAPLGLVPAGQLPMAPRRQQLDIYEGGYLTENEFRKQASYVPRKLGGAESVVDQLVRKPFIPTQYGVRIAQTLESPTPPEHVRRLPQLPTSIGLKMKTKKAKSKKGDDKHVRFQGDDLQEADNIARGGNTEGTHGTGDGSYETVQAKAAVLEPLETGLLAKLAPEIKTVSADEKAAAKRIRCPSPSGLPPSKIIERPRSPSGMPSARPSSPVEPPPLPSTPSVKNLSQLTYGSPTSENPVFHSQTEILDTSKQKRRRGRIPTKKVNEANVNGETIASDPFAQFRVSVHLKS